MKAEAPAKVSTRDDEEKPKKVVDLRMLIDELGSAVDLVVDDEEQVLLGVVLGHILVGVFLRDGRHLCLGTILECRREFSRETKRECTKALLTRKLGNKTHDVCSDKLGVDKEPAGNRMIVVGRECERIS
jgi:hypothetical protein